MVEKFFEGEVMGRVREIKKDRVAVDKISQFWREILPRGYSIAYFKENSDDIIAMNVLDAVAVNDPIDEIKVNLSEICFFFLLYFHFLY